jgi:hypothetical protein
VPLFKGLSEGFHGSPLASYFVTVLFIMFGGGVVMTLSFYLRQQLERIIKNKTLLSFSSLVLSIGLTIGLLLGGILHTSTLPAPYVLQDATIKPFTLSQPANGLTNEDITSDTVGKWAALFIEQGTQSGKKACLDNGGNAALCAQPKGEESHQVIRIGVDNIGVINLRIYSESRANGGTLIVSIFKVLAIREGNLVSVSCQSNGSVEPLTSQADPYDIAAQDVANSSISVRSNKMTPPCAEEIQKSLGIKFASN